MECCPDAYKCDDCECRGYCSKDFEDIMKYALDLINRLQAENERLKMHQKDGFFNLLGNCLVFSKTLKDYNDMRKGLKAEAYKEFAEILKLGIVNKPSEFKASQATVDFLNGAAHRQHEILDEIENTLKETEREDNG